MSVEEKKGIVRRFTEEVWNKGNMVVFEETCAEDFVYQDPAAPSVCSREDYRQFVSRIRGNQPDGHYTIEDMIAERDKVVVRYAWRGTHQRGEVRGISPIGKQVAHAGVAIYRFVGVRVTELHDIWDALGAYEQLGFRLVAEQEQGQK